ncbi:hypothetical protein K438DRAFT_1600081, partial [Mycena galopus ATCC 62051]
ATFPTPLRQATSAVEFLFDAGVRPEKLHIAGDSAGGKLVLQIVSQMLHAQEGVPAIRSSSPICGVFLSSPWVSLTAGTELMTEFDGIDFMSKTVVRDLGAQLLSEFPEADGPFAEPAKAPDSWFRGVDEVVERVFITAGRFAIMRDDHRDIQVEVLEGEVHEDMLLDFMTKEKKLVSLIPMLIHWLAEGCA